MIDCKKLPIPKYKVGDKVWIVNCLSIAEVEIKHVEMEVRWFDSGYTSRQEYDIEYEVTTVWGSYTEKQLYTSKRTAQRVLSKQKVEEKQTRINELRNNLALLKSRCSSYGLTIDDL